MSESKYRNELRSKKLISGVLITLSLFSILPSRASAETEMNSESKQSYNEEKDFNEQIEMFKNLDEKENNPKTAESNNLQEFNKESSITDGSQNILLTESDEGKDVLDLKIMLEALGYKIDINEYFDLKTTDSVIHFQDANELKVTGVVDLDTINLITYQYEELFSDNSEQYPMEKSSNESTDNVIDFFNEYERNEDLTFEDSEENKINTFNTVHQQAKSNVFLKNGMSHPNVIQLKKDLAHVGFAVPGVGNADYGPKTASQVRAFQRYYGLDVTGIYDEKTEDKLQEIVRSPFQLGNSHTDVIQLKKDLALINFAVPGIGNKDYGPKTESQVKAFQEYHDLVVNGIVDKVTKEKIEELISENKYTSYDLTLQQALDIQMRVNPQTDRNYTYVSKDWVNSNGEVLAEALNVRTGIGTANSILGQLKKGDTVNIISEVNGWYQISYNHRTWVNAALEDVKYYLNPINFQNNEKNTFQFLNLEQPSGASAAQLDMYLYGKGILHGMGQAFIDAGKLYGVNEIYLLSHALLETGHGTSTLARGVNINGRIVYNMYGIGAYDDNPVGAGSQYAYAAGWFTPESTIIGGAAFIGNSYIKSGLNTLYKMRWNPAAMVSNGSIGRQYATDIGWAYKQVSTIYNLYNDIGISNTVLDIPVYK